ncbi:MAG TPA: hypothetical protein VFS00_06115 [Polyangiaceae bacterium]|nr:hypothetical protein [Polyangiaceae bacterium]
MNDAHAPAAPTGTMVLDNAPVHRARACAEARHALREEGMALAYLPA